MKVADMDQEVALKLLHLFNYLSSLKPKLNLADRKMAIVQANKP